jgi:UDP-N-acetylglucosamine acyltransferase
MTLAIHPTAIVEDGARLGAGVTVGAFTIIGPSVVLEDGAAVDHHVVIRGRTTVGQRTRISPFVMIGGDPQDLSYKGEDTAIVIGPDCILREHATVHRGTARGRGTTTIGAHCFLMGGSHVAHDCILGDRVILTNAALVGGHAVVGDYAILGGGAAVQQRTRIGAHSFIGGLSGVTRDVVPFVMALGQRARLAGINARGLRRRNFDVESIHRIRAAYQMFFRSGGPRAERIAMLAERFPGDTGVALFVDFLRQSGDRPLALPRRVGGEDDDDGP